MFAEDVSLGVMPLRSDGVERASWSVCFVGSNDENARARILARCLGEFDSHGDDELISWAIIGLAKRVAHNGAAVYELVTNVEPSRTWSLVDIPTEGLLRLPGGYVQFVPQDDRQLSDGRRTIWLPRNLVWRLAIPRDLGGPSGFRAMLRMLRACDAPSPEFWLRELQEGGTRSGFDVRVYRKSVAHLVAAVTYLWGWDQRGLFKEYHTEFYQWYRMATFRWAQLVLRDHLILELNKLLRRLAIDSRIVFEGLPTPSEMLELQADLLAGNCGFQEASKRLRLAE